MQAVTAGNRGERGGRGRSERKAGGFTLVELVVILLLVAILSAIAFPRILADDLRVVPVAERMAAEIRYAQALAMTHGEAHQFRVGGGSFRITRTDSGCGASGSSVPLSDGEVSGSYQGLNVSGSTCISFSSLFGTPSGSHTVQVSGSGNSAAIQVSSGTGYVLVQA